MMLDKTPSLAYHPHWFPVLKITNLPSFSLFVSKSLLVFVTHVFSPQTSRPISDPLFGFPTPTPEVKVIFTRDRGWEWLNQDRHDCDDAWNGEKGAVRWNSSLLLSEVVTAPRFNRLINILLIIWWPLVHDLPLFVLCRRETPKQHLVWILHDSKARGINNCYSPSSSRKERKERSLRESFVILLMYYQRKKKKGKSWSRVMMVIM